MTDDEHREWARRQKLEQQRYRRSKLRRIDYYASPEADRIIDMLRGPVPGGDASSILDRIVIEWAARQPGFRNKVVRFAEIAPGSGPQLVKRGFGTP